MQPGNMAYDRAITVFSPDGRLFQVEYAREAVKRGTTTVGLKYKDGVILIIDKRITSPLIVPSSIEKIFKIDEFIGCATSGLVADARVLVDRARIESQINKITYNEPIELTALVKEVSDRKQRFTQLGGIRPYGVSFLFAGMDGSTHLYETDPSGALREWKAHAMGRGAKEAKKVLLEGYKDGMNMDEAIALAIKALEAGEKKIVSGSLEIGVVEDKKFRFLKRNEIKKK